MAAAGGVIGATAAAGVAAAVARVRSRAVRFFAALLVGIVGAAAVVNRLSS